MHRDWAPGHRRSRGARGDKLIGPRAIAARAAPGVTKLIGPRAIAARAAPGVTKLIGPRAIVAVATPWVTTLIGPRAIAAIAAPGVTSAGHSSQSGSGSSLNTRRSPPPQRERSMVK